MTEVPFWTTFSFWFSLFSGVGALGGAVVSWWQARRVTRIERDEQVATCAVQSLERAYEALTEGETNPPLKPNRLNWLTAARQILNYRNLKSRILSKEYVLICEQAEEYWRHRFYLILQAEKDVEVNGITQLVPLNVIYQGLERRSVVVVHDFVSWAKERKDVLDEFDALEVLKESDIPKGNPSLELYLRQYSEYAEVLNSKRSGAEGC